MGDVTIRLAGGNIMAMLMKKRGGKLSDKVEQQMTPMIDIVFQLLAFFVMTFKVASPEGDFSLNMPSGPPKRSIDTMETPPIKVVMKATAAGELEQIVINPGADAVNFGTNFRELAAWMKTKHYQLGGPTGLAKDQEIELNCDYRLKYKNTMQAVTAVSGRINDAGEQVVLFEKVKFSRQKPESM
jgi:biopolymer transport protein ExbD